MSRMTIDRAAAEATIAALADLFPDTFTRERWQPHRPVKVGIDRDLVAAGLLSELEVRVALRLYVARVQYQRALAHGGSRFDLSGNPSGSVTAEQQASARAAVVRYEAIAEERLRAATANYHATKRAAPRAMPEAPAPLEPAPTLKRRPLGLADLRRLGEQRKRQATADIEEARP